MTPELKPCPFCGGSEIEICNTHTPSFWAECQDCEAEIHGEYFETPGKSSRVTRFSYRKEGARNDCEATYEQLWPEYQKSFDTAVERWNTRAEGAL